MVAVGIDSRDCIIMVRTHMRITVDKITKNRSSDQTIAEHFHLSQSFYSALFIVFDVFILPKLLRLGIEIFMHSKIAYTLH